MKARFIYLIVLIAVFSSGLAMAKPEPAAQYTLAVVMPAPAKTIHKNWQPLVDYLSEKMGKPVQLLTPKGLDQAKAVISKADFVFANSYLFSLLKDEHQGLHPIAQMRNTDGSIYSRGRFLVRSDSKVKSAEDLKGKKIALISPLGSGAYLAPRAYLTSKGVDVDQDVEIEFTKSLKKAAYMVMLGEADSAVMCDVSYKILSSKMDTGDLRFFDKTEPFHEAVVFTAHEQSNEFVQRFQQALMQQDTRRDIAMRPLHGMKIQSFVAYDPVVEKNIRSLRSQAGIK